MRYLLSFAVALLCSVCATYAVRAAAHRLGLIAHPRADRWHRRPTALYGGVAMYAGLLCAHLALPAARGGGVNFLMFCASAMFVLGLVDDRLHLKPHVKLAAQIIVSALFTRYGLRLQWLPNEVLDQALTIFWLVGITNALNLLDNIDGLAAGVAAIGALFLVYLCHRAGRPDHAALSAALCGTAVGFLLFNFNPATIFMGDCGSLLLGFFLGGMALTNTQMGGRRNLLAVLLVPVLLLLLPIVDTTLVTISRKLAGRPISTGGKDHASHRLVALGLSERAATVTLWTLAAAGGGAAVLVQSASAFISIGLVALLLLACLYIMVFLGRVQVYGPADAAARARGLALLPTLADFSYKRRIFEVSSDLILIILCYYMAFLLRFDGQLPEPFYGQLLRSLPAIVCVQLGAFLCCGLYRGLWRYTGLSDLLLQLRAVLMAASFSALAVLIEFRFEGFSRAVFAIDAMLLLLLVSGSRLSFRLMHLWVQRRRRLPQGRRTLIYGANEGGELVVQELLRSPQLGLLPVGFVDDDPRTQGRVIHGLRVLGSAKELPLLLRDEQVTEVVVAPGALAAGQLGELQRTCGGAGARIRQMRISLE
ncbi:MAG: hypothetical protein RMK29_05905 [Myxococcales bacterium]|nr:hypothetical protein [Myxococcota bacterium]MDW8281224.1 hypothetical protein [Myxococcales bacterium]